MTGAVVKDLLLIEGLSLSNLIEEYRLFFLGLLPSVFMLAVLVEYFDRLEPFSLVKRAVISVLILTSVTSFYSSSIETSMEVADSILEEQKLGNILLMDMFSGINHWDNLQDKKKSFYKDKNVLEGIFGFFKHHLFDSFINDAFTVSIYFLSKLCFLILKVVYSLVYYLGYGLIGVPCLIYLFPTMGNVLRGGILSFIWCLIVPHILVFIISMISVEINKGYLSGQIIGGSMMGTALLFVLTLFIAFTPLIGAMILTGAGVSAAGGVIASMGANFITNLPKNTINTGAALLTGATLGPKMKLASSMAKGSYKMAFSGGKSSKSSQTQGTQKSYSDKKSSFKNSEANKNSSSNSSRSNSSQQASFKNTNQTQSQSVNKASSSSGYKSQSRQYSQANQKIEKGEAHASVRKHSIRNTKTQTTSRNSSYRRSSHEPKRFDRGADIKPRFKARKTNKP